jgi:hypothetical protein
MELLLLILVAAAIVVIAVWLYIVRQGDAELEFLVDQRSDFVLTELGADRAVFACDIPFVNKGSQDGTIMDCYPRHLLPQEQFDAVGVASRIELESARRTDGYFEALIVPKTTGSAIILTVTFTAKQGGIREALAGMVDMPVDIVFQVVGRGEWYISKQRLVMSADEIARVLAAGPAGA